MLRIDINLILFARLSLNERELVVSYIDGLENQIRELMPLNKPDWDDAPEWANYLAQDGDGGWWWYEKEPTYFPSFWVDGNDLEGKYRLAGKFIRPIDASKTLEQRPK